MPLVFQICAVVVTIALVVVTVVAIRAMRRFENVANEFSKTSEMARQTLTEIQGISREAQEITATFGRLGPRFREILTGFGDLGHRATSMSTTLVQEVGAPVLAAVTVVRALRSGAARFFRDTKLRPSRHRTLTNGGVGHE